jgi:hypothetical protein
MKSKFHDVSNHWMESIFGNDKVVINVLVVADGNLTFFPGNDFGLNLFCETLRKSALPWETIHLKTAHRGQADNGADFREFKFDKVENGTPVFSINRFDVVWLFGFDGEDPLIALPSSEKDVVTAFMNQRGGVFATGDHQDLGCALCGDLPRIRRMRRWHFANVPRGGTPAPDLNGPTRLDTLREGITPGFQPEDQEDNVPQEIRPKFFVNCTLTAAEPHPLLAMGNKTITILPDHMHEGECVPPKEIEQAVADQDPEVLNDFPTATSGRRVLPEIVAISTSAGGTFIFDENIFPVEPRCYIVISAYDGHLVEHTDDAGNTIRPGRIVVDASFHHFANVNLSGFIEQGTPDEDFKVFSYYFRNILSYLLPPDKQIDRFTHLLLALRFTSPLLEDIQDLSQDKWADILYAGHATRNVIAKSFSPAYARSCALSMVSCGRKDLQTPLRNIINLWDPQEHSKDNLFFLSSEAVTIAVLGSVMLGLASSLPRTYHGVREALSGFETPQRALRAFATEGLGQGLGKLQERMGILAKHLVHISNIA